MVTSLYSNDFSRHHGTLVSAAVLRRQEQSGQTVPAQSSQNTDGVCASRLPQVDQHAFHGHLRGRHLQPSGDRPAQSAVAGVRSAHHEGSGPRGRVLRPVAIRASDASVAGSSCFVDSMVIAIRELYRRHQTILRSGRLSPTQKFNFEIYQHFSFGKGEGTGERKLADAVAVLCDALATVYEKPVYVFVDNYDFPLLETLTKGKPMVNVQPFLTSTVEGGEKGAAEQYLRLHSDQRRRLGQGVPISARPQVQQILRIRRRRYHQSSQQKSLQLRDHQADSQPALPNCALWLQGVLSRVSLDFLKHNLVENPVWFEQILQKKLNRLLNSDITDLEDDEVQLIMKLLFDMGVFTPAEVSTSTFSLSCHCSPRDSIKLRTIETSRLTAKLPVSLFCCSYYGNN
ncbi:hypothetical protein ACFE04_026203 [Oxalis oulophora]